MSNSRLYLAPCNHPQLNRYFDQIVLTGIEDETYQPYINKKYNAVLHFWGITEQKGQRYSQMGSGDFLLFYVGDGKYSYAAEVLEIESNPELIQALKSNFSQEESNITGLDRWEYCIYLQSPFSVEIDSRRLHDYAGHSRNRPFNFCQLNKQGKRAIREEYGDVAAYLQSKSTGPTDESSKQTDSGSGRQFESTEEVINIISRDTGSSTSTIKKDVSKLHQRDIPLKIIHQIVQNKYGSNSESSVLLVDAVGAVRAGRLHNAGYKTIHTLADTPVSELANVREISSKTARVIKEHSQELMSSENTAKEIVLQSDDNLTEVEKTLRAVGATGVARSEARPIVSRLHTHPSLLDIHRLQRQAAYHLMDHGYETPKDIAEADPEALTEIPYIGDENVSIIQESATEFAAENKVSGSTSNSLRLSNLGAKKKKETARILGIDDIESLDDEEWDAVLSHFFGKVVDSPFDFQFNS